jgi:hypothetical protein
VALQRAAGAEGDQRHLVFAAQIDDLDHLGGAVGPHHAVGQGVGKWDSSWPWWARGFGGGKALAEAFGELLDEGVGRAGMVSFRFKRAKPESPPACAGQEQGKLRREQIPPDCRLFPPGAPS